MNSYWCAWERNWLVGAALSAVSETDEQPVANVVNEHTGTVWRSLATSAQLDADFSTPRPVRHLSLHGMTNLTPAATLRWRLSNVLSGGGELLDTRLSVSGRLLTEDGGFVVTEDGGHVLLADEDTEDLAMGVERRFDQFVKVLPEAIDARYSRVEIFDPTNADGFIDVGAASIGAGFVTERNFDYGGGPGHANASQGEATPGGQTYIALGPRVRSFAGVYRHLPEAQAMADVTDLTMSAAIRNALFVPFPDSAWANRQAIYGLLDKATQLPVLLHGRWGWSFTITERL